MELDINFIATIITALGVLITALVAIRSSTSKSVVELTEAVNNLISHLRTSLDETQKEVNQRDKIIIELVAGVVTLRGQLAEAGLDPGYKMPRDIVRKWGNGSVNKNG